MTKLALRVMVFFRKITSPIFYWLLRLTIHRGKLPDIWNTAKKLDMEEFEELINSYPYKPDFFKGLVDNTLRQPDFFFVKERKTDRDCLPEIETVYINGGQIKKLKDVKVGDKILSYNFEHMRQEYKRITNIWNTGKKDMYKITFKNGAVSYSSEDHRFFGYQKSMSREYSPLKIEEFEKRLETNVGRRRRWKFAVPVILKADYFEQDVEWLNEDMCFILGYYWAEGYKSKNQLRMGGKEIPTYLVPLFEKNKIKYSLYFRKSDNLPILSILNTGSKFWTLLRDTKETSDNINPYDWLSLLPKTKLKRILDGVFMGDGHYVYKTGADVKSKNYSTTSTKLKDFLIDISYKLGNPVNVYYQKNPQGAGKNPLPIWILIDNSNSRFKKDYGYNSLSETTLKSIEFTGQSANMIDIEVKDNHNFFLASSGVLVHNCDDFSQMWYWWAKAQGYKAWEIAISYGLFKMGHMFCVFLKDDKYHLADYTIDGAFDSLEEAVLELEDERKKFVWVIYRK